LNYSEAGNQTMSNLAKSIFFAASLVAGLATTPAMAQFDEGSWLFRTRLVNLDSANKGVPGLSISDKTFPEVGFSYFVSPNFAVELAFTYQQKHDIRLNGVTIGSLKQIPPTLLAQYHFTEWGAFKPYVGVGINYTRFSSLSLIFPGSSINKSSTGLALQAGIDYEISKNMYLNLDIKKIKVDTDVTLLGVPAGNFKIDPWVVGAGIGWAF
jgi:outer membrane protein